MIAVQSMPSRKNRRWIAIFIGCNECHLMTEEAARELVVALVAELAKPADVAVAQSGTALDVERCAWTARDVEEEARAVRLGKLLLSEQLCVSDYSAGRRGGDCGG